MSSGKMARRGAKVRPRPSRAPVAAARPPPAARPTRARMCAHSWLHGYVRWQSPGLPAPDKLSSATPNPPYTHAHTCSPAALAKGLINKGVVSPDQIVCTDPVAARCGHNNPLPPRQDRTVSPRAAARVS
jgi:hypothetical protein